MPRPKKSASSSRSSTPRFTPLARPTPNTQKLLRKLQKDYPHVGRPLSQSNWVGCDCVGACRRATCSCLRDNAPCRQSCQCGPACADQFPVCQCRDGCAVGTKRKNCPCYLEYYQCREGCGCFASHGSICDDDNDLPKTEIKESDIPSAGLGYFAKEDIGKGRLIGVLEGEIEPNPEEPDFDCFEIANGAYFVRRGASPLIVLVLMDDIGISLRCSKQGIYYVHELHHSEANAEYRYMEGKRRRETVSRAKRDIMKGEEITAQYSENRR